MNRNMSASDPDFVRVPEPFPLREAIQPFSGSSFFTETEFTLRNPRAASQMVRVGGRVWVVGGRAYVNHFAHWGESGFCSYNQLPNPESVSYTHLDVYKRQVIRREESGKNGGYGTEQVKMIKKLRERAAA